MKLSEFARGISEADVALGRLRGFTCTEEGCEGKWERCDGRVGEEKARKLLDKLRKLGLPDLPAELEKIVGRPVTVDDICAFWGFTRLYQDCIIPGYASKERCRKEYRRALEEARERFKNIPGLKKRLANLLAKLDGVGRFELEHFFVSGSTHLRIPLDNCDTVLVLKYDPFSKDFMIIYYPPHEGPLARELKAWLAGAVEDALRGLGLDRYETTTVYGEVKIWLSAPDPGAALDLFGFFVDLALVLNETCVALPVRYLAGKTRKRVRV